MTIGGERFLSVVARVSFERKSTTDRRECDVGAAGVVDLRLRRGGARESHRNRKLVENGFSRESEGNFLLLVWRVE